MYEFEKPVGCFNVVGCCLGADGLPTLDDCDRTADAGARLFSDLGKIQDAGKKAELIHSGNAGEIDTHLGVCLMAVRIHVAGRQYDKDLLRLYDYADIETKLLREEYDTLRSLTEALQATCH
jgi:hypothetical protein